MYPVYYPYYPMYWYPLYPSFVGLESRSAMRQQYPSANAEIFSQSAKSFQHLMKDSELFVNKISASSSFAHDIMEAAQRGDKSRVQSLVASTGIKEKIDVQYNPDQLRISLTSKTEQTDCCKLTLSFRWR